MSPNHSDQMFQRSQVSRVVVFLKAHWVSEWVSDKVTYWAVGWTAKKHFQLLILDARMGGCNVEARVGVWRGPKAATSSSLDLRLLPPTCSCSSKNPASKIFQKSWILHPGLVTFTRSWRKEYELFLCKERRGERQGGDEAQERGKIFLNLIPSDHMMMWWDGHMTLWREENMIMLLCNDAICKGKVERCLIDMMPQHGPAYYTSHGRAQIVDIVGGCYLGV